MKSSASGLKGAKWLKRVMLFELVPIHSFIEGTGEFSIQKCAIFRKFKEISGITRRRTPVRRTSDSAD